MAAFNTSSKYVSSALELRFYASSQSNNQFSIPLSYYYEMIDSIFLKFSVTQDVISNLIRLISTNRAATKLTISAAQILEWASSSSPHDESLSRFLLPLISSACFDRFDDAGNGRLYITPPFEKEKRGVLAYGQWICVLIRILSVYSTPTIIINALCLGCGQSDDQSWIHNGFLNSDSFLTIVLSIIVGSFNLKIGSVEQSSSLISPLFCMHRFESLLAFSLGVNVHQIASINHLRRNFKRQTSDTNEFCFYNNLLIDIKSPVKPSSISNSSTESSHLGVARPRSTSQEELQWDLTMQNLARSSVKNKYDIEVGIEMGQSSDHPIESKYPSVMNSELRDPMLPSLISNEAQDTLNNSMTSDFFTNDPSLIRRSQSHARARRLLMLHPPIPRWVYFFTAFLDFFGMFALAVGVSWMISGQMSIWDALGLFVLASLCLAPGIYQTRIILNRRREDRLRVPLRNRRPQAPYQQSLFGKV